MNDIILIAAPGGEVPVFTPSYHKRPMFAETLIKATEGFTKLGSKVTVIGDSINPLTLSEISDGVRSATKDRQLTTIFLLAHSSFEQEEHFLHFDDLEIPTCSTRTFFSELAKASKKQPIDLFMTACWGGSALDFIDELPKNSTVTAIAPSQEMAHMNDIERLAERLHDPNLKHPNNSLSAKNLFDIYVTQAHRHQYAPVIGKSGEGISIPEQKLKSLIGRPFSSEERQRAYDSLSHLMSNDKIGQAIQKIESAQYDHEGIFATNIGPVLAVAEAALPGYSGRSKTTLKDLMNAASNTNIGTLIQSTRPKFRRSDSASSRGSRGTTSDRSSTSSKSARETLRNFVTENLRRLQGNKNEGKRRGRSPTP
jgi:hypothetical protein